MNAPTDAKLFVVIPAAGTGSRMQMEQAKQYITLHDQAVLDHTLRVFSEQSRVRCLVVCLAVDDHEWQYLEAANNSRIMTTLGGETRAESVLNGLMALNELVAPNDWVLVHDAARPCLSSDSLARMIDTLYSHPSGGILAVPARDTLKKAEYVNGKTIAAKTLDRGTIWQAQTPQMFRYGLLHDALANAVLNGIEITDEASAMEYAGHEVVMIEGEQSNLKITTQEDLQLARSLLQLKR